MRSKHVPKKHSNRPSIIIQSVPGRRAVRERLLEQLPTAVVAEDDGPPPGNPWRGYQLALQLGLDAPVKPAHLLVIQDDAIVCRNFLPAVERLIELIPNSPICLFYPGIKMNSWRNVQKMNASGKSVFVLHRQDFMPVVAVLWPREKAEHFLFWTQGKKIPGLRKPYRSDDAVAGAWMKLTHQDVYVAHPSLVQHPDDVEPVKDGPQIAGHGRDRGRIALAFCEGDPLEIEWRV